MNHKIIKLMSVALTVTLLWQSAGWAEPSLLRPRPLKEAWRGRPPAMAELDKVGEVPRIGNKSFIDDFEFKEILSYKVDYVVSMNMTVIKFKYTGEDKILSNGVWLKKRSFYVVKAAQSKEKSDTFLVRQAQVLSHLNPDNKNDALPALIGLVDFESIQDMVWERSAVPNPRLLGRFQGDAIILEYVDGKELSYYANYISRRKPNGLSADKEQAFIDLALKILEAYKRTYADKGYVHGDISPTDIMVVEKNGKVERVVFFDNDTPAPLNSRLVVDELRKNAFKHLFASRDRQNRTEPLSLKERCLPRDDVYSLCETLICVLSDLFRDTITPRGKLRGLNLKLTNYKILAESADFGNKPLLNDLIVKVKELTGGSSAADATAAVLGADILRPLPEPALSSV